MLAASEIESVTHVQWPARYHLRARVQGLAVAQLATLSSESAVSADVFRSRGPSFRRVIARNEDGQATVIEFANSNETYGDDIHAVVRAKGPRVVNGHLSFAEAEYREDRSSLEEGPGRRTAVQDAWQSGINYRSEIRDDAGAILRAGLRPPQVGALHAIASHWTLSSEPALVVMPTGTGKTEVMIAGAVASACNRLLVIVPTDALRHQTAMKFANYGVLESIGVIEAIPFPVVGVLSAKPTPVHFAAIECCNVVVTTMASLGLADEATSRQFATRFSHVFFDEAHHMKAVTWNRFHGYCGEAHTLMLTATPFREDGKPLEGRVIYNYPLSSAQRLEYFNPISFVEVFEPDENLADQRIAEAAVNRLREDLAVGHDHLLMARAQTIDAAARLYDDVYSAHFADLNPVLIHSQTRRRQSVLDAIRRGDHRIIVCVDMFGEGFDLPRLKVAALHSIHKSLGITLQFIGRFARTAGNVGRATFVANTAEDGVPESLESLYFDDPDWNLLLPDLSYDAIDP
jgi:superfamily II DNA or RNA helicase